MCDEITFFNPGLLVVSVEQCALAVKCDLMPGMTKVLTLRYEKDQDYLFTFKCKGLISIQKYVTSFLYICMNAYIRTKLQTFLGTNDRR